MDEQDFLSSSIIAILKLSKYFKDFVGGILKEFLLLKLISTVPVFDWIILLISGALDEEASEAFSMVHFSGRLTSFQRIV